MEDLIICPNCEKPMCMKTKIISFTVTAYCEKCNHVLCEQVLTDEQQEMIMQEVENACNISIGFSAKTKGDK